MGDHASNQYPSHYRHPSLAPNENPASDDDDDMDKDHGRYLSTLIHENVDSDYEMTPSDDQVHSTKHLFTKNISRLRDYWCHSSAGIAIEDDTDAHLQDKQMNHKLNKAKQGSVHEINDYTRPFMSKIKNMNKSIASVIIGISADLIGESSQDSFASKTNGFGFDNFGNIMNGKTIVKKVDMLQFESRDVVHIILDYSDATNWKFYAKVGDIEESDYDDLKTAAVNEHIFVIFDAINPGSYRLAVSLFSQMDALIIESCKIHGSEQANFYQELKSYSVQTIEKTEEKIEEEIQPQKTMQQIDEEKVIESEPQKLEMQIERISSPELSYAQQPNIENENDDDAEDEDVPIPINQKMQSVIVHNDDFIDQRQQVLNEQNDANQSEQQPEIINSLKTQIADLQKQNEAKQALIDDALKRENESKQKLEKMTQKMSEYETKNKEMESKMNEFENENEAKDSEQKSKMIELSQENERLCHELKLAQDRVQSLDDNKVQMQDALNNAIESKMKLIVSTSEEIDHYRKLIQQIAQNKLGCQILSDFLKPPSNGGKNGYY